MSTPVTVYTSDDLGAPQIVEGRPSEYLDVLKKCLIDGYGNKPGAGWILAHSEVLPPFMAIKNDITKGASGGYLAFSAVNNEPLTLLVGNSCYDWIDIGVAQKVGPNIGLQAESTSENWMLSKWMIIATYYGFYMFVVPPAALTENNLNGKDCICFYAGDITPAIPNDPSRFITLSGAAPTTSINPHNSLCTRLVNGGNNALGSIYGTLSNATQNIYASSLFGLYTSNSNSIYRNTTPDITMLSPVALLAGSGEKSRSSFCNDTDSPFFRGILPGAFVSPQLGYDKEPMPHIKTLQGESYWQMPSSDARPSSVWINTESW